MTIPGSASSRKRPCGRPPAGVPVEVPFDKISRENGITRGDLERFVFLLGGSDGEQLFSP
jgi:hypothetical protein